MEQTAYEMSTENPSLLMLNDDCLREMFKFLQLDDFVDLAVTCSRLLYVAQQCKKFKTIKVTKYDTGSSCTVQEFAKILAVIGAKVGSVDVGVDTFDILKAITDSNSGIAELDSYYSGKIDGQTERRKLKSLQGLLPFRNLKKLQFGWGNDLSTDEWRNIFENNRGIETLKYSDGGCNNCIPLLHMLLELKSLKINNLELNPEEFHHLTGLKSLMKLSIWSLRTCNQLLIELAENLKLEELRFTMRCDVNTFAIIKSFRHLEVLSIANLSFLLGGLATTIFPSMLKKIKLDRCDMLCSVFLSIVKHLTLLDEFELGICGRIFWDNDESESIPKGLFGPTDLQGSQIIYRIAKELRVEKRNLKLIFDDCWSEHKLVCKYSDNLEIFINPRRGVETAFDHTFQLQGRGSSNWPMVDI